MVSPSRINLAWFPLVFLIGLTGPVAAGTWDQAYASGDAGVTYADVFFFDRSHGWIVGDDNGQGFVLYNDSGDPANWQDQSLPPGVPGLRRVVFVSATEGWAVGEGERVLHYTAGGGWQEQRSGTESLAAVFFLNALQGWIADDNSGTVRSTSSGGVAWGSGTVAGGRVHDLAFSSSTLGWAVTEQGAANNNIWVTDTGGGVWWDAGMIPINTWMFGLEIVDASTVLAVGASGQIWIGQGPFMPDGFWSMHDNTASPAELHDIDLAAEEPAFGWAVGSDSTIVHSVDAGATWFVDAATPAGIDLLAVTAVDRGFAWAVGNGASGGVLLRFACVDVATDCADTDACTSAEACAAGECQWGPLDCSDGNPCTDDLCDAGTGCSWVDNSDGCDDGQDCTTGDTCLAGACLGSAEADGVGCSAGAGVCCLGVCQIGDCCADPDCDDGESCTDDACQGYSCSHQDNSDPCDDSDACTLGDACAGGSCQAGLTPLDCDDGQICTDDSCDGLLGCQHDFNVAGCDDGDPCTVGDTCAGGVCQPGQVPLDCDDAEVCTDDSCQAGIGCQHVDNMAACEDGDVCTLGDSCVAGLCQPGGAQQDCNDFNACTDDSCDPTLGCQNQANAAPCDDGDLCTTVDVCIAGSCQPGSPLDCNDSNPCTDDSCLPASGCQQVENSDPCDDADACTMADTCLSGVCLGQAKDGDGDGFVDANCGGTDCDDGQAGVNPGVFEAAFGQAMCSDGLDNDCDSLTDQEDSGCIECTQDADCDDGDLCNGIESCAAPTCLSGVMLDCDDANACTDDSCAPASGCVNAANTQPCDDGNLCTQGDRCAGGSCSPGSAQLNCDDGEVCTDDSCDPASGCVHAENQLACQDGDACTVGDACLAGQCLPGADVPDCDDGSACTADSCDPSVGCRHQTMADGTECAPRTCVGLVWQVQTCHGLVCDSAQILSDCADAIDCTIDRCVDESGCERDLDHAACEDGEACTSDRCDALSGCVREAIDEGETCGVCYACTNGSCAAVDHLSNCQDLSDCSGLCSAEQVCVVEGQCASARAVACPAADPRIAWDAGVDCRLPVDAVDLQLEPMLFDAPGIGFLSVRLRLTNRMDFPLGRLALRLRLRPGGDGSPGVSLVAQSARFLESDGQIGEVETADPDVVALALTFGSEAEPQAGLAAGDSQVLQFLLEATDGPRGAFEVSAWAPCQADLDEIGCHIGYADALAAVEDRLPLGTDGALLDVQRVSAPVLMTASGQGLDSPDEIAPLRSLQLGCQCGSAQGGFGFSVWFLIMVWGLRRKRAS